MQKSLKYREVIADTRRIVIKIGSRVIIQDTGKPDIKRMRLLVNELAEIRKKGKEVVIVTSGAIGTGMEILGMKKRPQNLPDLQMTAAVGQCRLMSNYDKLFTEKGYVVAQILLTHSDFQHKIRLTNARRTMETLLRNNVIPIINENDAVADEEIKADLALGDNDLLASLVVKLIRADLLIMLTTVDGVLEYSAKRKTPTRLKYIESITDETFSLVREGHAALSKGGMESKLKAAQSVAHAGCISVIANGKQNNVLSDIINCKDVGTLILASGI